MLHPDRTHIQPRIWKGTLHASEMLINAWDQVFYSWCAHGRSSYHVPGIMRVCIAAGCLLLIPQRATQIPRASPSELARVLRTRGAGPLGYVVGGGRDACELPLEEAIESSLASGWGTVVSCIPGRLALYLQEFPRGDTFILSTNDRNA
jgi:hypothetical protein